MTSTPISEHRETVTIHLHGPDLRTLPAAIQRTLTALPQNQQGDIKFKRPVPAGLSDSLDQTLIIAGGNILAALLPLIIGEIRNLFSTNKSAGSHRESSISIRVSSDLPLDIDIDISIS